MTSKKRLLLAFIWALVVMIAVHALEFPGSVQDFRQVTGGLELLDTKPSFDIETIRARIESYGEAGRANYRFRLFTVDVLLPFSLTAFLFLLMRHGVERVRIGGGVKRLLLGASLVYLVFDLSENASLFFLLSSLPSRYRAVETRLPYFPAVKRG